MIKFFRTPWQSIMSFVGSEKLRLDIWTKNRFRRYLLYAIGEIMLIMIGILLALSVNNWNENRKSNATTVEIYHNLLQSLQQDSVEIRRIINFQKESLEVQKMLLTTNFFPKYGVFNSVVSENEMDLIHSNELKMSLINLYDYQYKRYENIDAIVDQKFRFCERKMLTLLSFRRSN